MKKLKRKEYGKLLEPMQLEFLKMVLSKSGQEIAEKDGYIPLPAAVVKKDLELLAK